MKKEMLEKLEILIEKYTKVKQSHQALKTITLTSATQHQILDQNIHLLEEIIADLIGVVGNVDTVDSANFSVVFNDADNICNACNKPIKMRDGVLQQLCECYNEMESLTFTTTQDEPRGCVPNKKFVLFRVIARLLFRAKYQ